MHVIAATFADRQTFDVILAGFAAFGSVVGFFSAFAGCISALRGDPPADVANASALGLALAAPVGLVVAGLDVAGLLKAPLGIL